MTGDGWDFEVQRVDLDGLSIDAGQRLGMIIVQPVYQLDSDGPIPFRISNESRVAQKGLIEKAFQIREAESQDRGLPIPFILLPEFAIPISNPDGLACLSQQMQHAKGEVIFIGGLEGLSLPEAHEVADRFVPKIDAAKPAFAAGVFVNICVIAVKSDDGQLSWHFQAKLRPSKWEQDRSMARGQRVLYFFGDRVAFLCQICFDHIAAEGEETLNTALVSKLIERIKPSAVPLDFVFVPQYNRKPNHPSVCKNTGHLLSLHLQNRLLKSDLATAIVVNKAASEQESSEYGRSGFHYREGRWQVSDKDLGPKGYELYKANNDVTSAIFRKRTQAIHVATLVPPLYNIGSSENPHHPLENPRSYLISGGCDPAPCSCLPVISGTAGEFVECDCLPCKLRDSLLRNLPTTDPIRPRWTSADNSQSSLVALHYDEIRLALLVLKCGRAVDLLDLLFLNHDGRMRNPDMWTDSVEMNAVRELAAALSVLREYGQIDFETAARWTALLGDTWTIAVLDGKNTFDCHDIATRYCKQHESYPGEVRSHPLLIVALRSKGRVEPIVAKFQPIPSATRTPGPFSGHSPYEPTRIRVFLCRDDLFDEARRAPVLKEYLARVMEEISV